MTRAPPGKNTCMGDSGGPAFAWVDGAYAVAGVTSSGDEHCLYSGRNVRVDVYADFLALDTPPAPAPVEPPVGGCGDETHRGRCDGDILVWCEDGQVYTSDCAELDMPCGYSAGLDIFACLAPPTGP